MICSVSRRATPIGVHFRPPQASRQGWPYERRSVRAPWGAIVYRPPQASRQGWPYERRGVRAPWGAIVYSRATPGGWPAWPSHGLPLPPMGPPLAAGQPGLRTGWSERLWGHPWRLAW